MRKRMETLKAKKDFRKLMKKTDIQKTLDQIEDFEAFYDNADNDLHSSKNNDENSDDEEDQKLNGVFLNEKEKEFYEYGKDMEFVRYHKRTTRNFHDQLQQIIT